MDDDLSTKRLKLNPLYGFVAEQSTAGVKRPEIERRLVAEKGLDADAARTFIDNMIAATQQDNYDGSVRAMLIGVGLLVVGAGLTTATYYEAAKNPAGGTVVITTGLFVGGAVYLLGGVCHFLRGAPKRPKNI